MNARTRKFEDVAATRGSTPLLLGITGPSFSGKTYSALRLAVGIQRVVGGDIHVIDTENRRATHYADKFKFRHIDFQPPFGPLDYLAALEHAIAHGAGVVVVDTATHEHSGPGGVMDQSEKFLNAKCGDDWKKREKLFMLSLARPKAERKRLNAYIARMPVSAIFCYRAYEKIKPVAGGEPIKLGWQPETTSTLPYEMTQRFLLGPSSDGVPTINPETKAERLQIKNPEQFRGWVKSEPLSEDLGERMARWSAGDASAAVYRFGNGPHKGKAITDVPTAYLTEVAEHPKASDAMKRRAQDEIERRIQAESRGSFDPETGEVPSEQTDLPV